MMDVTEYRARSEVARVKDECATDEFVKSQYVADAASWEALAQLAERQAVLVARFKV
jgi:hypothetical protein